MQSLYIFFRLLLLLLCILNIYYAKNFHSKNIASQIFGAWGHLVNVVKDTKFYIHYGESSISNVEAILRVIFSTLVDVLCISLFI